jgi:PAS domain S-box-containing protein
VTSEALRPDELEAFLRTVPSMIYRTRLPENEIEFVSEEMAAVAGYPASDFVGPSPRRRWGDLVHPEDRERARDTILSAPADGRVVEVEYRIRRADGAEAWILSRARKFVGRDGKTRLHGAAIDATARHDAEALRRRLEAEHARAAEIEASRARIVGAADEARKRLERDLHDGAQQRFVVSCLTLRRAVKEAQGTAAEALVSEALDHVQDGLAELRELARGLHPSLLTERGLAVALESLATRSPVPVELSVSPDRISPPLEAAVYFTVAEALTNVARYSRASGAAVTVRVEDATLLAEIGDDGVGGATASAGSGLRGLADRLEAIGGTLAIESPIGGGTVVRARLPLSGGAAARG